MPVGGYIVPSGIGRRRDGRNASIGRYKVAYELGICTDKCTKDGSTPPGRLLADVGRAAVVKHVVGLVMHALNYILVT